MDTPAQSEHQIRPAARRWARMPAIALTATIAVMGGCSDSEEPSLQDPLAEARKELADALPECSAVVEGAQVPDPWNGCRDADGVVQAGSSYDCGEEAEVVFTADQMLAGFAGGVWVATDGTFAPIEAMCDTSG